MVPQLVQNLLHLEGRRKSLDEDCSADGTDGDGEVRLREVEDVGPETGFEVVFHFREVEVGPGGVREEVGGVVEEVEGKVEYRAGDGTVVDSDASFVQVPSAGSVGNVREVGVVK